MNKITLTIISLLFLVIACNKEEKKPKEVDKQEKVSETNKITLHKLKDSVKFQEATITLDEPTVEELKENKKSRVNFDFNIQNYTLGKQTPGSKTIDLANSSKGQHIHFILNNDPYSAHYSNTFSKEIEEGHHVLLAFLSRSYHESVKNAYLVKSFQVGNPKGESPNLNAAHMFYSRPKGTYSGKDTENLLLDFFLVNTTISENGNKVLATINGQQFTITEWVPYIIKGLEKGEATIELKLVDANNKLIPGPFNHVTRKVTLQ